MAEKSKKSISRFLHSIDKCAKREEIRLADELEKLEEENWKKEEVKIIENARFLMMSELANIKNEISSGIYNVRLSSIQRIYLRKKEIEEEIFDICKTDIENFVETDEYNNLNEGNKAIFYSVIVITPKPGLFPIKNDP